MESIDRIICEQRTGRALKGGIEASTFTCKILPRVKNNLGKAVTEWENIRLGMNLEETGYEN